MLISLSGITWRYFHSSPQKSASFSVDVVLMYHIPMGKLYLMFVITKNIAVNILIHLSFHFCVNICEKVGHLSHSYVSGFILKPHRGVCCAVLAFLYSVDSSLCFLKDHALFFPFDTIFLSERLFTKCFGQDNL